MSVTARHSYVGTNSSDLERGEAQSLKESRKEGKGLSLSNLEYLSLYL